MSSKSQAARRRRMSSKSRAARRRSAPRRRGSQKPRRMSSKSRAARRRKQRFAARGLPAPGRLYELNCERALPDDFPVSIPKADPETDTGADTDSDVDTDEEGIEPAELIITTPAEARWAYQYVDRARVVPYIDEALRRHRGEQPVLTTHILLTMMLLGVKKRGRYMRTVHCAVLSGLDAAVAIEWGLLDPDTGTSLLSYNMVWRQSQRLEKFLQKGTATPGGPHINLQWLVDCFLGPSITKPGSTDRVFGVGGG